MAAAERSLFIEGFVSIGQVTRDVADATEGRPTLLWLAALALSVGVPAAAVVVLPLAPRAAGMTTRRGAGSPGGPAGVVRSAVAGAGGDGTGGGAAEAGQLQLNAFEPIIADSLVKSVTHLRNGCL